MEKRFLKGLIMSVGMIACSGNGFDGAVLHTAPRKINMAKSSSDEVLVGGFDDLFPDSSRVQLPTRPKKKTIGEILSESTDDAMSIQISKGYRFLQKDYPHNIDNFSESMKAFQKIKSDFEQRKFKKPEIEVVVAYLGYLVSHYPENMYELQNRYITIYQMHDMYKLVWGILDLLNPENI
ncbi:MAG: hypothetical protein LBS83_02270 [Holosporales bacterium]|jgi:hypothetical protein|nr:hypothetical protein [Holosporales bacterium]